MRAVKTLSRFFPFGVYDLVSPFAGGCSLEIALANQGVRVRASDIFEPLVCFWHYALHDLEALVRAVRPHYPMTCADKFCAMREECKTMPDSLERAASFFVLNKCTWGSLTLTRASFVPYGVYGKGISLTESKIDRLANFSCPNLSVDLMDYRDALARRPDDMAYLDPPYMLPGKGTNALYGVDGELHKVFNHDELAEILRERKGWVMSYNDVPEIRRMYDWATIVEAKWSYTMHNWHSKSNEIIIVNE